MSRKVREARAIMVAEKQLAKRLDHIDWEEDTLYPSLELVKAGKLEVTYAGLSTPPRELEAGDAG
jgi:hypothetical protein